MDLLVATGHGASGLFHDDVHLPAALEKLGIQADVRPWREITPDGTPVLMRSTWDYTMRRAQFSRWWDAIEGTNSICMNPVPLMRWNMDKRYLLDLEAKGHTIVPTQVMDRFEPHDVAALAAKEGWKRTVAKPVIGAGAEGLTIVGPGATVQTFDVTGLAWAPGAPSIVDGACLVQPFLSEVQTAGEWSIFFFGGEYSHAILKTPKKGDVRVQEEHGGTTKPATPTPEVLAAATAMVADVPDAVYARVDGVVANDVFHLMELELIEPELYFRYAKGAEDRFAAAIKKRMDQG